jgi:hypothetical protein
MRFFRCRGQNNKDDFTCVSHSHSFFICKGNNEFQRFVLCFIFVRKSGIYYINFYVVKYRNFPYLPFYIPPVKEDNLRTEINLACHSKKRYSTVKMMTSLSDIFLGIALRADITKCLAALTVVQCA